MHKCDNINIVITFEQSFTKFRLNHMLSSVFYDYFIDIKISKVKDYMEDRLENNIRSLVCTHDK